ncbi:MAG: YcxB family protein [Clostridia bacterium]
MTIPKFENKIIYTLGIMNEFHVTTSVAKKRMIALAPLGISILFTIAAKFISWLSEFFTIGLFLCVLSLGFFLFVIYKTDKAIRTSYKKSVKDNEGNESKITTRFFEDTIEVSNIVSGGVTIYNYENITCLKKARHIIILMCDDNRAVLLSKKGFSVGDYDRFIPFMETIIKNNKANGSTSESEV